VRSKVFKAVKSLKFYYPVTPIGVQGVKMLKNNNSDSSRLSSVF